MNPYEEAFRVNQMIEMSALREAVEVLEDLYETATLAANEWHRMYCAESDSHTERTGSDNENLRAVHKKLLETYDERNKLAAENKKLRFDLEEASVLLYAAAHLADRTIPELKKATAE